MFTGLVQELGEVKKGGRRLAVRTSLASDLERGDSIAVNGVCLTAVDISGDGFEADVMEETLARSSLGRLQQGDRVNLELALRGGDRLGAHFVQGHVDSTGRIESIEQHDASRVVPIRAPPDLLRFVVEKGSIAVDGVPLTVVDADAHGFSVAL